MLGAEGDQILFGTWEEGALGICDEHRHAILDGEEETEQRRNQSRPAHR